MKDTSVSKGVVGTRGRHLQAVMGIVEAHQPIASVAALSERHAGWQYWWHEFNGAMLPDLSLRGPEGAVAP